MNEQEKAQKYIDYKQLDCTFLRRSKKGRYLFGTINHGAECIQASVKATTIDQIAALHFSTEPVNTREKLQACIDAQWSKIREFLPKSLRPFLTYRIADKSDHFSVIYTLNPSLMLSLNTIDLSKTMRDYKVKEKLCDVQLTIASGTTGVINSHLYERFRKKCQPLFALSLFHNHLNQYSELCRLIQNGRFYSDFSFASNETIAAIPALKGRKLTFSFTDFQQDFVLEACAQQIDKILKPYWTLLKQIKAVEECVSWFKTLNVKNKKITVLPYVSGPRVELTYTIQDKTFKSTAKVAKPYRRLIKNEIKTNRVAIEQEHQKQEKKLRANPHYGNLLDCELMALVSNADKQNKLLTESSAVKIMRGLKLQSNWYDSVQNDFQARWGKCNFAYIPSNIMTDRFRAIERDGLIQSRTKRGEYGSFEVFKPTPLGIKIYEASKNEKKADKSEYAMVKELQTFQSKDLSQNVNVLSQLIDKPALFCVCQNTAQKIINRYPERCKAYLDAMAKVEQDKPDRKKVINVLKKLAKDQIKKKARKL